MKKPKLNGFTVVEIVVVIIVIALLATITTVAYRETQKTARNEKRKSDVIMLTSALDEYYADKGSFLRLAAPLLEAHTNVGATKPGRH